MRIVIAGAGEVGYNLAKVLSEHHDVFVIEKDEVKVENLNNLNVSVVQGNSANVEILKSADVKSADVFLAVTGNDEVNLLSGIFARRFGAKKVIVRVGNPEYVDRPVMRDHPLGFDLVVCPQLALANEVANILMIPGVVEFVALSGGKANMVEVRVENSPAVGKTISKLNLPRDVLIVAIFRDGNVIIPKGDTVIEKGDVLVVFGKSKEILRLKGVFGKPVVKDITIFGGGTVGSYIAKTLEIGNFNVKIIDTNLSRCEKLDGILRKTKVVCGDATDLDFLIEEDVGKSDVVIATTESDERNLLVSLLSKSLGAKRTIAKVERGSYIRIFEKVGVDVALSPRRVTFIEVMRYLRLMDIKAVADVKQKIAVLEMIVKSESMAGKRVSEIKIPSGTIIGGIIRNDTCIIPKGDTEIKLGDRLLIFTTWDEMDEIEGLFD